MGRHGPGTDAYLRARELECQRYTFPLIAGMLVDEGFVKTCHVETARRYAMRGKMIEDAAIMQDVERAARQGARSAAADEWVLDRVRNRRLMAAELDSISEALRELVRANPSKIIDAVPELLKVVRERAKLYGTDADEREGKRAEDVWPPLPAELVRTLDAVGRAGDPEQRV